MSARSYSLPTEIESAISCGLKSLSLKLEDSAKIAAAVQRLSDFYISKPDQQTPWSEAWAQIAYLGYYFPLNALRAKAVIDQGQQQQFFQGLSTVMDFGAGLGSGSWWLSEIKDQIYVEDQAPACRLHEKISMSDARKRWQSAPPGRVPENTLSLFSYSLTELESLPTWALGSEALMIIEPSTRDDGRKLLELRGDLLQKGFHAWAPCTHQQACPLLTHSPSDWCHDRIHFEQPAWFTKIEDHLPMKNNTLTMSYLLMRKTPPPPFTKPSARMVGDRLKENGKTRQLVCRGPEREFMTWMDRDWKKNAPTIPRGVLIEWPEHFELKANEIRCQPTFL